VRGEGGWKNCSGNTGYAWGNQSKPRQVVSPRIEAERGGGGGEQIVVEKGQGPLHCRTMKGGLKSKHSANEPEGGFARRGKVKDLGLQQRTRGA